MSKCNRCNIDILDDSLYCPLCNSVLELNKDNLKSDYTDADSYISKSAMYPDITPSVKKMKFVFKLVIFCCVLTECALIVINSLTSHTIDWSIICGIAMLYLCFSFIYTFKHNTSHRTKMMIHTLAVMICSVLIDFSIGYTGWSVNFALPSAILVLDGAILVLLFANSGNWQSYILLQVYTVILSAILCILILFKLYTFPLLVYIAAAVSDILFIATLVFGEKKATTELKRRFHV
ncbi:MAG: DUF6320 domain-containing protein [Coprococcus sp.]